MKLLVPSLIIWPVAVIGVLRAEQHAVEAYLWCWSFWFQLPLGALAILLLHDLTGGKWAQSIRSHLKAMMISFLPLVLLFIPLLFALKDLFPWVSKAYLYRPMFFTVRACVYFITLLALIKGALQLKHRPYFSGVALSIFVVVISLLSTDWFMAREPKWYSSVYGLIMILSMVTNALGAMLVLKLLKKATVSEDNADQGSIFLVFLISWAYLAFMQFLIIWSANLPKEVIWYVRRLNSGWEFIILPVVVFSLLVPFFLLLNRRLKSNSHLLGLTALGVMIFRVLDVAWVILPATRTALTLSWWDAASFISIGGLCLWFFQMSLKKISAKEWA
jgi:hypothetical protein